MAFTDVGSYLHTTEEVHIGGSSDPPVQLLVTAKLWHRQYYYYYSSDIQLKENIRPIENVFKVQQLSGIQFTWNEKSHQVQQDKGEDVGLIGQEVEKVLPEIVITRENGIKEKQTMRVLFHCWLKL